MKCKCIEDRSFCFDCPYADCLVDLKGNLPEDEEQIKEILLLKRKEKDHRYYVEHRDEIIAKRKEESYKPVERRASAKYRKKHKKEIAERRKIYDQTHREQIRKRKRKWAAEHRESERERNRRYYAAHREEILARRKACAHTKTQ